MHIRGLGQRSLGRQFGWLWAAFAVSAYGSGIGFGAFPIIAVGVLATRRHVRHFGPSFSPRASNAIASESRLCRVSSRFAKWIQPT